MPKTHDDDALEAELIKFNAFLDQDKARHRKDQAAKKAGRRRDEAAAEWATFIEAGRA